MINSLALPIEMYGITGIETGNSISSLLKENNYDFYFNPQTKKIIVLKSSDLSITKLQKILDEKMYTRWTPVVEQDRDNEENLIVSLEAVLGNNYYEKRAAYIKKSLQQEEELIRKIFGDKKPDID